MPSEVHELVSYRKSATQVGLVYTQQVIGDIAIKPGPPRNFVWDHSKKLASTRSLFRQQFLPVDCKFEAKDARKTILIKFPILDSTNGILS